MKKNQLLTAALSGLIFLAVSQSSFVKLAYANPYIDYRFVPAPVTLIITTLSPENNAVYALNNLTLNFNSVIDNRSDYRYFQVRIKSVY